MACPLSLRTFLVFLLVLLVVTVDVSSLLVYDRQALLDLRPSFEKLVSFEPDGHKTGCPPLLSGIPARRRQGKRGGRLVKLKAWLVLSAKTLQRIGPEYHRFVSWRTLDPIDPCLVPVVGLDEGFSTRRLPAANPRWRGVNQLNLQLIARSPLTANSPAPPARFALVNARSLANKTFILKDLFESRGLDFLFIAETWLAVGQVRLCRRFISAFQVKTCLLLLETTWMKMVSQRLKLRAVKPQK
ncbi:uncharacterized protein LOC118471156 isoform X2 [Amphiprion ocellaris]|uniref:uncharacterized protein LOC118471156 isoform X2 n=1 Tax=Amphiprion ocellaris TaxID=80972 RepID=UPI0024110EBC|nr:uncharacterized protein LOC118471156 isoform X2 [Amphiprion ocellaris]